MGTFRYEITKEIVTVLKNTLDGNNLIYTSNLWGNVYNKLIFWDEVEDFPTVSVVSGQETREYLPGGIKWGFLTINIRIYVNDDNPKLLLDAIFDDIEEVLEDNQQLSGFCTDIRLLSITDDEGLLAPLGVGEMVFQVQYSIL